MINIKYMTEFEEIFGPDPDQPPDPQIVAVVGGCEGVAYQVWGPHEGCAEFMSGPEAIVLCGEPPVAEVVFPEDGDGPEDRSRLCQGCLDRMLERPGPTGPRVTRLDGEV